MAQSVCPRCNAYINVPNISDTSLGNCPVCRRQIDLYKCFSCMKVHAFIPGQRPRQCPSCASALRSGAPLPLGPLPPLPMHLRQPSSKAPSSSAVKEVSLEEYGKSGDHPPNEFSVVDAHLPAVPVCGAWVRNTLQVNPNVAAMPNWTNGQYVTLKYTVSNWIVLVVWPKAYTKFPPAPNRLGWLPQMEFGALAGQTDPKKFPPHTRITFRYRAMSGSDVDLDFTPS